MIGEVMDSIAGRKAEPTSVDTGQFMASIPIHSDLRGKYRAIIKSDLDYPAYLEKGTRYITGRHHFENSLDRNKTKIYNAIKNATL